MVMGSTQAHSTAASAGASVTAESYVMPPSNPVQSDDQEGHASDEDMVSLTNSKSADFTHFKYGVSRMVYYCFTVFDQLRCVSQINTLTYSQAQCIKYCIVRINNLIVVTNQSLIANAQKPP